MWKYRISLFFTALTLLIASSGANAGNTPQEIGIEAFIADNGVTELEAHQRRSRQLPLAKILARLKKIERERLAGVWITQKPRQIGWVFLVGNNPVSARARELADRHADVQIRYGAQYTLKQLETIQNTVLQRTEYEGIGLQNVQSTDIDVEKNIVTIGVHFDGLRRLSVHRYTQQMSHAIQDRLGLPVVVMGEDKLTDDVDRRETRNKSVTAQVSAAGDIFWGGSSFGRCTAGFTAYHPGIKRYGVLLAGHCTGRSRKYHGFRFLKKRHIENKSYDIAFWAPAQKRFDIRRRKFIYLYGTPPGLEVWHVALTLGSDWLFKGMGVCHSGKNSGFSCGEIKSTKYRLRRVGKRHWVKAQGSKLRSCGGDSGGPWIYNFFNGSRFVSAVGIHTASSIKNCRKPNRSKFAVFGALGVIEKDFNVRVYDYERFN